MQKLILSSMFVCILFASVTAMPTAKITIKVIDEVGETIEGAQVHASFSVPNASGIGLNSTRQEGNSNSEGLLFVSGDTVGRVGFSIDKEGYYQSSVGYEFQSHSKLLNRWEPWNPTIEVVLKKKRNPVPMFMKYTGWILVPLLESQIGYDLEIGDWVQPFGKGVVDDLLFEYNLSKQSYPNYEANLNISVSNPEDGIQKVIFDDEEQSIFKWPYNAPESGYKKSINIFELDSPETGYKTNKNENANYVFRVRSKVDGKGNIIEARYGKLSGEFGISRKGKTRFLYYFNPDGTRNLEEDSDQNLFDKN